MTEQLEGFTSAKTLADEAMALRVLDELIKRPDVYQINSFKQLTKYCITITFKQDLQPVTVQSSGLLERRFGSATSKTQPGRTLSCWGTTLVEAIVELSNEYDNRARQAADESGNASQVGEPVRGS